VKRLTRRESLLATLAATVAFAACQTDAPTQIGSPLLYVTGHIHTTKGAQQLAIRLDRQACFESGRLNFRDASGLGVLVIQPPQRGWTVRRYVYPTSLTGARGYLNVSGFTSSYPLVRGTTDITRSDADLMEGEIEWTLGQPLSVGVSDTTQSRLRAVGRFSAVAGCPD
jgi:hypothetical protein